jgi:flavin-dependent dehydrogenase
MPKIYDAIVVGGGVAGSYIASQLRGEVLLIEKNRKIVPKDSGIVSKRFLKLIPDGRQLIKFNIKKIECTSPSGLTFCLKSEEPFAYILKRRSFSQFLLSKAKKNADIAREMVQSVHFFNDHVAVKTNEGSYNTKMVIGCDGSNSVVRKSMGIESPRLALGIMVKTPRRMEGEINVFFNKYFSSDFFSWIIPMNREYGTITAIRPRAYFDYFKKNMYLPPGVMYANMIPYTYTKSYSERAILVGDACGQNKPLTGGGIIFSLLAAQHAIQIANDAIEENRFDGNFLGYYESYWKKELAWEIEKQFLLRSIYRKMTNKEIDELFERIGPHIEALRDFDYDKFSMAWSRLPKLKLIETIVKFLPRLIA